MKLMGSFVFLGEIMNNFKLIHYFWKISKNLQGGVMIEKCKDLGDGNILNDFWKPEILKECKRKGNSSRINRRFLATFY